jgi:hypothetical protein
MSTQGDNPNDIEARNVARVPVIVLSVVVVVALILGVATGSLDSQSLVRKNASWSDPITLP